MDSFQGELAVANDGGNIDISEIGKSFLYKRTKMGKENVCFQK